MSTRTYPEGVPAWVDVAHRDVGAASAFYGDLFGWTFTDATPPGAPQRYVIAQLGGLDVAGIGGSVAVDGTASRSAAWNTYVAVDDADAAAARIEEAGGRLVERPAEGAGGWRWAECADPSGVPFRLWEARGRPGAQAVNTPGGWNFSDLHTADPAAATRFYGEVFGWSVVDLGFASMIKRPGYGDHLEATIDPGIRTRQAAVATPPGFADAIGWLGPVDSGEEPHWHVTFTVADRDQAAAAAERLGGTVLARADSDWTRDAVICDPQGGVFTASQFTPPSA